MFFNRSHIYSVHLDPEAEEPLASAKLVRDGFNLYAFALMGFWVLYHRMWMVFATLVMVDLFFYILAERLGVNGASVAVGRIFVQVWLGLHANDLLQHHLIKKGYLLKDVVSGPNVSQAQQRYFDRAFQMNPKQPVGV